MMFNEDLSFDGGVGLVLSRRAGENIYVFWEDTETLIEILSINQYPKSADIRITCPSMEWRLSSRPWEAVGRLSMAEGDSVHLFSGNVAVRLACVMIERNQIKLGMKSHPSITIYREELVPAIEKERRDRGIAA